jgi:hypothetical protein
MERNPKVKKLIGVFVSLVLIVGCASMDSGSMSVTPQANTGFLKSYYYKLEPGPEGGAKMRWIKPDVDWARYNYIMLDSTVFFFAKDSEYTGIDAHVLTGLADDFNKALVDALKDDYPIVTEPGIDVLRIRFAITDLKESHPGLSAITTVVPIGLGISILKKGATGSWTGSGATGAEMMALDSMTNDVLAVAHDEQSASFGERFSKWGSAEEAFKFWAERLKIYLDNVHHK